LKYAFLILFIPFLVSCSNNEIKTGKLNPSFGSRNQITIVMEDDLWIGPVGDSVRKKLAKAHFGLTKDEPIFDLLQYSPAIFKSKSRLARNTILFSNKDAYSFILEKSLYATPQNFFFVRADGNNELIQNFNKNADSIISVFRNSELNEEQHQLVRKPLLNTNVVKEIFACTIKIPASFRLILKEDNFLWYQKDIPSGNSNLIIYEIPIETIENKKADIESNLIRAKDSVAQFFVQGFNSNSYFHTETSFPLIFKPIRIQQFLGYEIYGTWEMTNNYMSGPFICFAIKDEYFDRYLFFEGFINNPFKPKRDLLFEMEAIIKTVNFYDNEN